MMNRRGLPYFAGLGLAALAWLHPGSAASLPTPSGSGFSQVEYRPERGVVAVTVAEWPPDGRIFLTGLEAEPLEARLNAGRGGERPLPLAARPEGWYIFLPPAPPRAGVNEILIAVAGEPRSGRPTVLFADADQVLLTAENGVSPTPGEWRWQVKFPQGGAWIALAAGIGSAAPELTVDGRLQPIDPRGPEIDGRRVLGTIDVPASGIREVALPGLPDGLRPQLRLMAIARAALRLPGNAALLTGGGLKIAADGVTLCNWGNPSDYAVWTVPALLPGRYVVEADMAAEQDSVLALDAGAGPVELEVRATGAWDRFRRWRLGEIEVAGPGLVGITAKSAVANRWQPVNLRQLTLYPVGDATACPAPLPLPPRPVAVDGRERFSVPLTHALLTGERIQLNPQATSITHWTAPNDTAEWRLTGVTPGRYRVTAPVAAMAPTRVRLSAGAGTVEADIPNTGSWENYRTHELGILPVSRSGEVLLTLFPAAAHWMPLNIGDLQFERVE